jgi:hypothetical protein
MPQFNGTTRHISNSHPAFPEKVIFLLATQTHILSTLHPTKTPLSRAIFPMQYNLSGLFTQQRHFLSHGPLVQYLSC